MRRVGIRGCIGIRGWMTGVAVASAVGVGLLAAAPAAQADVKTLRVTHPTPERVVGFRVYMGFAPGTYHAVEAQDILKPEPDAQGVFHLQVEMAEGVPVYVAVKAFGPVDTSDFSNEEQFLIEGPVPEPPGKPGRPRLRTP
jgi:hypothetical protein